MVYVIVRTRCSSARIFLFISSTINIIASQSLSFIKYKSLRKNFGSTANDIPLFALPVPTKSSCRRPSRRCQEERVPPPPPLSLLPPPRRSSVHVYSIRSLHSTIHSSNRETPNYIHTFGVGVRKFTGIDQISSEKCF